MRIRVRVHEIDRRRRDLLFSRPSADAHAPNLILIIRVSSDALRRRFDCFARARVYRTVFCFPLIYVYDYVRFGHK